MADVYGGPFATYTDMTEICVAAGQLEIQAMIDNFAALFSLTLDHAADTVILVGEVSAPKPDFDNISPALREKVGVELIAMYNAIDAAPVA